MKKPMLNAIQKARMSMAMKSKNPKMNPGFDSLPKDVQAKIMKKKAKLSMKEPMMAMKKTKLSLSEARKKNVKKKPVNTKALAKRKAIIKKVRKAGEAKVSASIKKPKASQTAGAIMKRERLML